MPEAHIMSDEVAKYTTIYICFFKDTKAVLHNRKAVIEVMIGIGVVALANSLRKLGHGLFGHTELCTDFELSQQLGHCTNKLGLGRNRNMLT